MSLRATKVIDLTELEPLDPDINILVRVADGGAGTVYVLAPITVIFEEGLAAQPGTARSEHILVEQVVHVHHPHMVVVQNDDGHVH